jgi:hypothetical protein
MSCPNVPAMLSTNRLLTALFCIAAVLGIAGCKTPGEPTAASDEAAAADAGKPAGETSLLLSMTYAEAAAISPKKLEVPPFFKVAADEIEVVRMNKDGSPRNVRAKGKVFLQMDFREPGIALCQEAYFGDDEVILRGRPILKRGGSVVEGMASSTVFYILGLRLRVIGQHRLTNEGQIMNSLPDGTPGEWGRSWEGGPNPLLPPLSPSSVPQDVRRDMQKAVEAEAALQRSQIEPVLPLKEDAPVEKLAPLVAPPDDAAEKKDPAREPPKDLPKADASSAPQ